MRPGLRGNGFYVENGSGTYSFDNNSRVINWQSSQSNAGSSA